METFILLVALILFGASTFDGASTTLVLKVPGEYELNPLFGKHPSTLRVYLQGAAIITAEIMFLLFLDRTATTIVGMVYLIQSGLHIFFGSRNIKTYNKYFHG